MEDLAPHNHDAEGAVIGSALIDPNAIELVANLPASAFHKPAHAQIWRAMLGLHQDGKPTDFIMVCEALGDAPHLISDLVYLAGDVPTSYHVEHYASLVRLHAMQRAVIQASGSIAKIAYTTNDPSTLAAAAMHALTTALEGSPILSSTVTSGEIVDDYLVNLPGMAPDAPGRVLCGFQDVDSLVGGLAPGSLNLLAARPSIGKSALMLGISRDVARSGRAVLIFSLEMGPYDVAERLLATESGINSTRIRTNQVSVRDAGGMADAADRLREYPLLFDFQGGLRVGELVDRAKRVHRERGLSLVCVDYVQLLMAGERGLSENAELTTVSRALKVLAKDLNVPLLVLSQLNRQADGYDRVPRLSHLRGSGSLEQDADVVMLLHREEDAPSVVKLDVAKNRMGPTGEVGLFWDPTTTSFHNLGVRV